MISTNVLALMLAAALNPLVVRAPEPRGNVPADCEVSDRPATPRVQIADAAPEAAAPLPPVRPVASRKPADFAELNRALRNNDRPAFDAALARAKAEGQPTRVYEDVARLWDAQFEGPFFAQDSDAYRIASGYPGYEEAMRRHVFTDARGRKFYPAAESRAFVAGLEPATRTPAAPTTRRASSTPSRPTPKVASPSPRRTTTRPRVATNRTESRKPAAPPASAPPSRSPDPSAPRQPAAAEPAPAVSTAVEPSSTAAPPVAGSLETAAPAVEPAPVTTTTETAVADTATAPPTATTTAATTTASKGRPILLPAILILIGLGVLILLFRTKA